MSKRQAGPPNYRPQILTNPNRSSTVHEIRAGGHCPTQQDLHVVEGYVIVVIHRGDPVAPGQLQGEVAGGIRPDEPSSGRYGWIVRFSGQIHEADPFIAVTQRCFSSSRVSALAHDEDLDVVVG